MRKRFSKVYIFLFFALMTLMSLPKDSAEQLQGTAVAALAPVWHQLLAVKSLISSDHREQSSRAYASFEETEKLRLENTLLREEILHLKDIMQQELRLINQINAVADGEEDIPLSTKTLKTRYRIKLKKLLQTHLEAIPAKILFRSHDSWHSSFWIDVGSLTNEALGHKTIAKNSPVLFGNSVIGVIDYVGKRQARVRLITDSGLSPSVRAVRGGIRSKILEDKFNALIQLLIKTPGALDDGEQQKELIAQLELASEHLVHDGETHYLAKGELHGSSEPLWRTQRHLLKGIGFNYDYADGEGPARDLRTGKYVFQETLESAVPIVQEGDILVTTGMDGVFPPGLSVAEVTRVYPLKEGDYYYELDALPMVGNFDELSHVFVIPPIGYEEEEKIVTWK